jgi:hypothetical protein
MRKKTLLILTIAGIMLTACSGGETPANENQTSAPTQQTSESELLEPLTQTVKIEDLINVTFTGISPRGDVKIEQLDTSLGITFNCEDKNLKNGQTIIIRAMFNEDTLFEKGYVLENDSAQFIVNGLDEHIHDMSLLSKEAKEFYENKVIEFANEHMEKLIVPKADKSYALASRHAGAWRVVDKLTDVRVFDFDDVYMLNCDLDINTKYHISIDDVTKRTNNNPICRLYYVFDLSIEVDVQPNKDLAGASPPFQGEFSGIIVFEVNEPMITANGDFEYREIVLTNTFKTFDNFNGEVIHVNRNDYTVTEF